MTNYIDLKKQKTISFFSLLIILLLGANFVFALEVELPGLSEDPTLPEYTKYFFNWGVGMATTLAAFALIFGGLHYLISFGIGKITSAGKDWMKAGIMGLLILLCSYLIAGTINPQLTVFHLGDLIPISFLGNGLTPVTPPGPGTIIYKEIPIGTLTENVLARTISCYDFDENGDPIDGDPKTTSRLEPTFLNHDRIDCIFKLAEAVEIKAEKTKKLADKIAELMEECDCQNSCEEDCTECEYNSRLCPRSEGDIGSEGPCSGDCVGAGCKLEEPDCCPEGVKEQIEHGPIIVDNECKDGLDEFRTKYPNKNDNEFLNIVEEDCCKTGSELRCGINKQGCLEMGGKPIRIIKKDVWEELRLIDQLRYLKEKLKEMGLRLEKDVNVLKDAETELGKCYLAKTYAEFLKTTVETKKEDKIIVKQKFFKDPYTDEHVDISRYCKGFLYENSQCFNTCRNIHKIDSQVFQCFKGCSPDDSDCLKDCFDSPPFKDCLIKCRNQCLGVCKKEEEQCSEDCEEIPEDDECQEKREEENCEDGCKEECDKSYNKCLGECDDDSQCFVEYTAEGETPDGNVSINENQEKCYIYPKCLKLCADAYDYFENFEECSKTCFKCKYCTDQQAGYSDCLKETGEEYSSSFLYENPEKQKCQDCWEEIDIGLGREKTCIEVYPETAKGPSCSNCPECPCSTQDIQGNTIYRACSAECGEYSYNDDPLTFYCRKTWGQEQPLTGKWWNCPKSNEIPVGQTVDETEKWAEELIKLVNKLIEKTENMIEYIEEIGEEKDYCECDSLCNGDERACQSGCVYDQFLIPIVDYETGEIIDYYWYCDCFTKPCTGNPCQKMINLLKGKGADKYCPEGVEYKGVKWYYDEIKEALEKLKEFAIEERSEILKKLIYSRKKVDECSKSLDEFGKETIRFQSCERTWGGMNLLEQRCYGKLEGSTQEPPKDLTDNWFCCQRVIK